MILGFTGVHQDRSFAVQGTSLGPACHLIARVVGHVEIADDDGWWASASLGSRNGDERREVVSHVIIQDAWKERNVKVTICRPRDPKRRVQD